MTIQVTEIPSTYTVHVKVLTDFDNHYDLADEPMMADHE